MTSHTIHRRSLSDCSLAELVAAIAERVTAAAGFGGGLANHELFPDSPSAPPATTPNTPPAGHPPLTPPLVRPPLVRVGPGEGYYRDVRGDESLGELLDLVC